MGIEFIDRLREPPIFEEYYALLPNPNDGKVRDALGRYRAATKERVLLLLGDYPVSFGGRIVIANEQKQAGLVKGLEGALRSEGQLISSDRVQHGIKIGEGGMAVYRVSAGKQGITPWKRPVVLKFPKSTEMLTLITQISNRQFLDEQLGPISTLRGDMVSLLGMVDVNLEGVIDSLGVVPGQVMEYAPYKDLKHIMLKGEVSPHQMICWLIQAGKTLNFLHSLNIVHRDVKPDNIFIDHHGKAVLSDYDLCHFHGTRLQNLEPDDNLVRGSLPYTPSSNKRENQEIMKESDIHAYGWTILGALGVIRKILMPLRDDESKKIWNLFNEFQQHKDEIVVFLATKLRCGEVVARKLISIVEQTILPDVNQRNISLLQVVNVLEQEVLPYLSNDRTFSELFDRD
ncbi:MAG: serine/threonine protein kinase with PASTA sensor(s), serine/threonine protein kinase, bacterial [Candidatus Peregrinibacteria bacterium GW2011_GWE2_39_6]|nr:MAG: serine/threonine protein kinase with PASTA sensor(s), serine/threonine protein kinase, bacterial [Candidatus Peregrinibacteria bacterium GW2011_GWF2_39_17]KKR26272.1 MAG: serine/threonine protein kinase with PASTA sensor(s), serine/threonine protein kinase, bacterial [Candidatus Peregrinibacteria bacterium GW2011_GWE2_39_6]HCW32412.1 hypothetical protein [Candidatus Peregrinibacteria bacterium]